MKMRGIYALFLLLGIIACQTKEKPEIVTIGKAPSFTFTNQNNQTINNETYAGMVYVVDFFFTDCPTICPVMTNNMVKIQNELKDKNVGFASFSINPEEDTPEVLKGYAQKKGATSADWHFLTGEVDAIYDLSNKGFNLHVEEVAGDIHRFEHSGLFALIDQHGNIVSRKGKDGKPIIYYNGLNDSQVKMLIEDIKSLIE